MITFIKDRELAAQLRDRLVPSREKFIYYLLINIFMLLTMSSFYNDWMHEESTRITYITDTLIIILSIVGIALCYDVNKEGDDQEFIERITVIGFPAFVRSIILAFVIIIPPVLVIEVLDLGIADDFIFFIANLVVTIYFYYRVSTAIKIAANPFPPAVI